MTRLLRATLCLILVAVLVLVACSSVPKTMRTVRVAFPAKTAHYGAYFIAMEKGYFAEEGIDVQIVEAAGNAGVASVLAGETEFTTSAGVALSAILKGGEMKIIYTNMDRPMYEVWSSQADVRNLGDLRGKSLAVIGRGDSTEIAARIELANAGMDPDAVVYMALGPGSGRLAALQSGAVAAAILSQTDVQRLKSTAPKGQMLADVGKDVRMLFNGAATTDQMLARDPGLVAGFLRATLKGREYFKRFREETIDIIGKYNGEAPREANAADYDSVLTAMTADGSVDEDAQAADAKVRARMVQAETVRPNREIYDYSVVKSVGDELKRSGWQPRR